MAKAGLAESIGRKKEVQYSQFKENSLPNCRTVKLTTWGLQNILEHLRAIQGFHVAYVESDTIQERDNDGISRALDRLLLLLKCKGDGK